MKSRVARVTAAVLSVAFGLTGALVFQTPAAQALTATVNNVGFQAPVYDSYNHATGGGAWNDGSTTFVKGELLGTNYKCGDYATFMAEVELNATPTKQPGPYSAQMVFDFTADSTGQSGVALTPDLTSAHLKVNSGLIPAYGTWFTGGSASGYDGGFVPAGSGATTTASVARGVAGVADPTNVLYASNGTIPGALYTSGNYNRLTFTLQGLAAGTRTIIRMDAKISCQPNSTPTGNLQATLKNINVTSPGAPESVSGGNQTVNFRGVGNLAGLGAVLGVTKAISANGTDCSTTVATANYPGTSNVLYCYTITNSGTSDATGVLVKDDNATPAILTDDVTLQLLSAAVGGVALNNQTVIPAGITVYAQLSRASLTTGSYTNTVKATATNATAVTATATVNIGSTPVLSVVKTQTSVNPSAAGDVVSYSIVITNNTGNSANTTIYDPRASSITCGINSATAPAGTYGITAGVSVALGSSVGSSATCTVTHIVSAAEATAGTLSNQAYVDKPNSNSRYFSNTIVTPVISRPLTYDISVYKLQTSTNQPSAAGQTIVYSIQVTNIGTGTLTSVGLTENLAGTTISGCVVSGTSTAVTLPIATFVPGASFTCAATHTVTAAEITARTVTNTASATTTSTLTTPTNRNSNSVTTPLGSTPSLKIVKMQASQSGAAGSVGQYPSIVGQVLNYAISVINDGNVALSGVIVTDPNADNASLICASPNALATSSGVALAAGATIDCVATHTVSAADLTSGSVTNIAYATGTNGSTTLHEQSQSIVTTAALKIVKSVFLIHHALAGYTKSNDTIDYNIVVTNTGSATLTSIIVSDANTSGVTCPSTSLIAGASMTCTASHIVTSTETTAGVASNTAGVTTAEITAPIYSNQVDTPLLDPTASHVSIIKARTSAAPVNEGDTITYSLTITNDGNGSVDVTDVTDTNATITSCAQGTTNLPFALSASKATLNASIQLGQTQSFVCVASHVVTAADVRAGSVINAASVGAKSTLDPTKILNTTSNNVTDNLTLTSSLGVVKSYTSAAPAAAGDVVTYSIVVTNTGTIKLNNVSASDPLITNLSCPSTPTLLPGAHITCTGSYTVVSGDVTAGGVVNTASASGTDPYTSSLVSGTSNTITLPLTAPVTPPVTPPAPSAPNPSMTVVKAQTGGTPSKVGDTITYSITVTNNGDIALAGVKVTDANATVGTCTVALPATLAVGASFTCVATHIVTDADFTAGHVDNTAIGSSTTGPVNQNSNLVTTPVTLAPLPALTITKKQVGALPTAIGGFIHYTITVTNIGNIVLHDVTIKDDNAIITTCTTANPVAALAVGDSFSCSAKHALTDADVLAGKVINIASATSKENATASSGSSSAGGSTGSNGGSSANPGSVNVPSNEVLTIIKIASLRHTGVTPTRPNGGTVTLGAAVLKNPKLTTLAFTGDLDNVQSDASLFFVVFAALVGILGFRRRALKK